jgi:O-antigen biosynthesis protein
MTFPQRFDQPGLPTISEKEADRRWARFVAESRGVNQNYFVRAGLALVSHSRPLERLAKSLARSPEQPSRPPVPPSTFPENYVAPLFEAPDATPADVLTVVLPNDTSPERIVRGLNDTLSQTSAAWLFLADPAHGPRDRDIALAHLRQAAHNNSDVVYADESGPLPQQPIYKTPSVGPHSLLSYNTVGRPALLRIEALRSVGGFSEKVGRCFEHDLYLRLLENGCRFQHVARVLPAGRTSEDFSAQISHDTLTVVKNALDRRGGGSAQLGALPGLVYWRPEMKASPSVDIIIPTRDRLELLAPCIESIESITSYPNYRIIILDNDSVERSTLDYFASSKHRVIASPGPFNYAKIMNQGVSESSADFIVTLNNDTVVLTPDWLEQLIELASMPDVGIVGARLLDQYERIEHEGFAIAPYPQHLKSDSNYLARDCFINSIRDISAVTGAAQAVSRDFWNELGGMDETLRVTMNDVDLCLRAQAAGRYVVYTPYVELIHQASSSRGSLDPVDDRRRFIQRWDIFGSFKDPHFPESLELLGQTILYRA